MKWEYRMSLAGLAAVEVLAERMQEAVDSLRPGEWIVPSRCGGWSVQDLVAHTGSNFHVVADPQAAPQDRPAGSRGSSGASGPTALELDSGPGC
jgi:hypothetical protein